MDIGRGIIIQRKQLIGIQRHIIFRSQVHWIVLFTIMTSCESDPHETKWFDKGTLTISQFVEANQNEYSKFYRILAKGKLLSTLYAYNPHGEGYTLFLPTDEAIDQFIRQNPKYGSFEELMKDTNFLYSLTRYHTLNRKVHTSEFPDGALNDRTLSGERLAFGFHSDGNNQLIKVNNEAPVIKSNLQMINGYVHVISGVLQQVKISGYDWLQQQDDYSILAQAMELSGIRGKLKWNKYTILAEHDSVFHRMGINKTEDLVIRIATPGVPLSGSSNAFYLFTAHHILTGEFYLNDLYWGDNKYMTLANKTLTIIVGQDIRINPGIETFRTTISQSGDTTVTDYIRPVWEACNIMTLTGPVHSISNILFYEPFPK